MQRFQYNVEAAWPLVHAPKAKVSAHPVVAGIQKQMLRVCHFLDVMFVNYDV